MGRHLCITWMQADFNGQELGGERETRREWGGYPDKKKEMNLSTLFLETGLPNYNRVMLIAFLCFANQRGCSLLALFHPL